MSLATGKLLRLSRFLESGKVSVILQADLGLSLGPVDGLENMDRSLELACKAGVDAVILASGQVARHVHFFKGRSAPSILARVDWSNSERGPSFALPASSVARTIIDDAEHAAFLGCDGVVLSFQMGYGKDDAEADNLASIAELSSSCSALGLPVLVEVSPVGERVTDRNYGDIVKLAARMSIEAGADAIVAPNLGADLLRELAVACKPAPIWVKLRNSDVPWSGSVGEIGIAGFVLGPWLLSSDAGSVVGQLRKCL